MVRPTITYDEKTQHFVATSPDWPGNAVARSSSLQMLEDFLDYLENRSAVAEHAEA